MTGMTPAELGDARAELRAQISHLLAKPVPRSIGTLSLMGTTAYKEAIEEARAAMHRPKASLASLRDVLAQLRRFYKE